MINTVSLGTITPYRIGLTNIFYTSRNTAFVGSINAAIRDSLGMASVHAALEEAAANLKGISVVFYDNASAQNVAHDYSNLIGTSINTSDAFFTASGRLQGVDNHGEGVVFVNLDAITGFINHPVFLLTQLKAGWSQVGIDQSDPSLMIIQNAQGIQLREPMFMMVTAPDVSNEVSQLITAALGYHLPTAITTYRGLSGVPLSRLDNIVSDQFQNDYESMLGGLRRITFLPTDTSHPYEETGYSMAEIESRFNVSAQSSAYYNYLLSSTGQLVPGLALPNYGRDGDTIPIPHVLS